MTTATKITRRHPLRNEIAELSDYYAHKADAVQTVDRALAKYGWETDCADFPNDSGSANVPFFADDEAWNEIAGYVHFAWYRMPSGRYEFTVYVT